MAKNSPVQAGGKVCSDKDAAACLAQGGPKSGAVPQSWGQKDQNAAGQKFTTAK
jgi:hypothetical protein